MTPDERAQIRAEAIRECIEALLNGADVPGASKWVEVEKCGDALRALLPKPDPAKELVEEWYADPNGKGMSSSIDGYAVDLIRWLIDTGRLKG